MKKLKATKEFFLDKAEYIAKDGAGNTLRLRVNYLKNEFSLKRKSKMAVSGIVEKEIKVLAKDLLRRKANINFAEKN